MSPIIEYEIGQTERYGSFVVFWQGDQLIGWYFLYYGEVTTPEGKKEKLTSGLFIKLYDLQSLCRLGNLNIWWSIYNISLD